MSTEYKIFSQHDGGNLYELELGEHSGRLDLTIYKDPDAVAIDKTLSIPDMTPEQVIGIALEMIKVASYQIGDDEAIASGQAYIRQKSIEWVNRLLGAMAKQND